MAMQGKPTGVVVFGASMAVVLTTNVSLWFYWTVPLLKKDQYSLVQIPEQIIKILTCTHTLFV